jgi:FixJ family two-component response regulator
MNGESALVAVVDDDQSVRESLLDLVGQFGFAAEAFSSARDFLAWPGMDQTACLVLDICMPGMSGPDLQRELKRRRSEIPIVYVTAHEDADTRPELLALGAVECLRKPFSQAEIRAALAAAVPAGRSREAKPCVYVVDDDISVRESLELLIAAGGFRPHTFATAEEFLALPRDCAPRCLILDVSLPDLNGLELQRRLIDQQEPMPIIFITGRGDIPMTVQAMKAGAIEFLTKPFGDEVLLEAVRGAVERSRAALADAAEREALRARFASLSPREQEVMALVVAGLLNKQVGAKLGISEITVKAHRGKVMRKMKAESLADLVKTAAILGLGTTDAPPLGDS